MVTIIGGGPAGAAAALAALQCGAEVRLFENSRFPRHKVCGEFLTPEILPLLERLGVLAGFQSLQPARMDRLILHLPRSDKSACLPEPAFGLSRYAFDRLLLPAHSRAPQPAGSTPPLVVATGRPGSRATRGARIFGFKAHFDGPASSAVELFFLRPDCYVGVNPVENGLTNVCGLAPESLLQQYAFNPDALVEDTPRLAERLASCSRRMDWIFTGPLNFRHGFRLSPRPGIYAAGDALCFADPFTGTGIAAALLTGISAGRCAAHQTPVERHIAACRQALARPFAVASAFRAILNRGWADHLAHLVPTQWLVRWTRPALRIE